MRRPKAVHTRCHLRARGLLVAAGVTMMRAIKLKCWNFNAIIRPKPAPSPLLYNNVIRVGALFTGNSMDLPSLSRG
jgi:hypothetical protein